MSSDRDDTNTELTSVFENSFSYSSTANSTAFGISLELRSSTARINVGFWPAISPKLSCEGREGADPNLRQSKSE
jgi:hypothetical protein